MTRVGRTVRRAIAAAAVVYALACGLVAVAYRPFLYPAPMRPDPPAPADATKIEAATRDGTTARALRFGPAPSDGPPLTVVYFHGNGELAEDGLGLARALASHGWAAVLAEYRGYGMSRSAGSPTEQGLYDDAEAIVGALGTANDRVVLMGFSLGTGVAVEMAARGHGRALVLLAPYTSIPDVAARHVPILPMRLLMRDRFDSASKVSRIDLAAFVAHGDRDAVVPFDMGEALAHALPHGSFMPVAGANHTDMFETDAHLMPEIGEFLVRVTP